MAVRLPGTGGYGEPVDESARRMEPATPSLDAEQAVRAFVAAVDIDGLEIVDCDPALADTAAFCQAYGYEPADSANAILVMGKADPPVYAVCVVLATTRLDVNKTVRKRLGTRRASFAPAEVTTAVSGMAVGGVTPIGLPDGLPVWIDARVMERERVVLGGGSRAIKVVGPPSVLTALPGAEVVDGLALAPDPG
ncbi:MAG: YbaK/EbsC family protein [Acidimicrobiales bacterium]